MGLLFIGTPYEWDDAKVYADHVREHGIQQFIAMWNKLKERKGDGLYWGDEIEYMVVSLDEENKNARLSLRQSEILDELASDEAESRKAAVSTGLVLPTFHPEFGRYMLESTPGAPYRAALKDLLGVEANMRWRRKLIRRKLLDHEIPVTFTSFPRLGVQGVFLDPHHEPLGEASQSLFLPDEIINPHVRFPTLAANIRRRRGAKVAMNMPIYRDKNTPDPFIDPAIPWDRNHFPGDKEAKEGAALPNHIYMDAMGFGMGCSCLQITFQAYNLEEARRVYDALVPVGPIMLALTAAAPMFRGYLADVDCRWDVIAGSVDDRTEEERGKKPLKNNKRVIAKSRYDSVDSYLSTDFINRPEYSDNELPVDEKLRQTLLDGDVDEIMANHIAHLFIRDPLVIFSETLDQDDSVSGDHFENIQSTNWQTMRFKPPPSGTSIGWRVEFRSMEVQLTDYENAAFAVFIVLLSRAILSFGINFYMPISKVDANMKRAHQRNACREQKFYFRKNIFQKRGRTTSTNGSHSRDPSRTSSPFTSATNSRSTSPSHGSAFTPIEEEYEEMTMNEIINGKGSAFPGLLGLVYTYINSLNVDLDTKCELDRYLNIVKGRADGSLKTTATFLREFVNNHPAYKHDSVVSQEINYDMVKMIDEIERGVRSAPDLLGTQYRRAEELEVCEGVSVSDAPDSGSKVTGNGASQFNDGPKVL